MYSNVPQVRGSILLFVTVLLLHLETPAEAVDYCAGQNSLCPNPADHVMCLFPEASVDAACGEIHLPVEISSTEKSAILNAHNNVRDAVASGEYREPVPFGQRLPAAMNINLLKWDDELAALAQRWANQCTLGKDKCRNTIKYSNVGQLVFRRQWIPGKSANYMYLLLHNATRIGLLQQFTVDDVQQLPKEYEAFAQLLWAKTSRIGCGRTVFDGVKAPSRSLEVTEQLVCNYGNTGIMRGPVYEAGFPCQYCICDNGFTSLCRRSAGGQFGQLEHDCAKVYQICGHIVAKRKACGFFAYTSDTTLELSPQLQHRL